MESQYHYSIYGGKKKGAPKRSFELVLLLLGNTQYITERNESPDQWGFIIN